MERKANLWIGFFVLWFSVVNGASLSSVVPSAARYTGGTPIKFTGSGFADGAQCYWSVAKTYTYACISSSTAGICFTPSFQGSGVMGETVQIYQSGVLSNSVGFSWNPNAALATYGEEIIVTTSSGTTVGAIGATIPVNITLSTPLPCKPVQFTLSHPHGTFSVPSVTFNVGETVKNVNFKINSASNYPLGTYAPNIIDQNTISPFQFDYIHPYFFTFQKYITLSTANLRIDQGVTIVITITLSATSLVSFTLTPSGSFIFNPTSLNIPAGTKTTTIQVTPTSSGRETITFSPSISEYSSAEISFAVIQKILFPSVSSSTILVGNSMNVTITLSKASSRAVTLYASTASNILRLSATSLVIAAGVTVARFTVTGLSAGSTSIYFSTPQDEYADLAIPFVIVTKSIKVSGIPSFSLVGNAYTLQFILSSAPSSSLILTAATSCHSAPTITINPPATTGSVTVIPVCYSPGAYVSFSVNLYSEFEISPFAVPVPRIKTVSLSMAQTLNVGISQILNVTLSASPKSTLVLTLSDSDNVLSFNPKTVTFAAGTTVLRATVAVTGTSAGTTTISATPNLSNEFDDIPVIVTVLQKFITLALSSNPTYVGTKVILNITLSSLASPGFTLSLYSQTTATFSPATISFGNNLFAQVQITPTRAGNDEISFTTTPYSQEYAPSNINYVAIPRIAKASSPAIFLRGSVIVTLTLSAKPSTAMTLTFYCYNCGVSVSSLVIPISATIATVTVTPSSSSGSAYLQTNHDLDREFTQFNTLYWSAA